MATNEMLSRLPVSIPKKSLLQRLGRIVVAASRPTIGGIDKYDLEEMGVALPLSILYITTLVITFITLLIILTQNQMQQKFLSPIKMASNTFCSEVPLVVSGEYRASYKGVWETSGRNFKESETLLVMAFSGSEVTSSEYESLILYFQEKLNVLGEAFSSKAFVYNAMMLSMFGLRHHASRTGFWTDAKAEIVFTQETLAAVISSRDGICSTYSNTGRYINGAYDLTQKVLAMEVPLVVSPSFINDPETYKSNQSLANALRKTTSCPKQFQTRELVLDTTRAEYRSGKIKYKFDIRSILSAVSKNMGFDMGEFLTLIETKMPGLVGYVDPYYQEPPMDAIWCLDKQSTHFKNFTQEEIDGPEVCFVAPRSGVTEGLFYPVLSQLRSEDNHCVENSPSCRYSVCKCPDAQNHDQCNKSRFTLGFFFGNDPKYEPSRPPIELGLKLQKYLIDDPLRGDSAQMRLLTPVLAYSRSIDHDISKADEPILSWKDANGKFVNNSWADGRSFNELLSGAFDAACGENPCSALVFDTLQDSQGYINRFRVTFADILGKEKVGQGASCRNIFADIVESMPNLLVQPPTSLVNDYYACQRSMQSALGISVGSSIASATFLAFIIWTILGHCIISAAKWRAERSGIATLKGTDIHELKPVDVRLTSPHAKRVIADTLQRLRDDSLTALFDTLTAENKRLSDRLARIESKSGDADCTQQASHRNYGSAVRSRFDRFYGRDGSPAAMNQVGAELTEALKVAVYAARSDGNPSFASKSAHVTDAELSVEEGGVALSPLQKPVNRDDRGPDIIPPAATAVARLSSADSRSI